ncbi:hypothetical protein [Isoptericola sediminis]|uniref:Uncharacterized protein n=1 Tax=Isoptericola sediminis TaxID=2733572 RepID=A0A849JZP2_9MICO|nr:hypothetical protein [Isoptericola sediminis]NNU26288.1 hypothetical protein [Isoptericola sediminis]
MSGPRRGSAPAPGTAGRGRSRAAAALVLAGVVLAGCQPAGPDNGDGAPPSATTADVQRHPDVLEVVADCAGETCDLEVTMSSPYDTPERYADGWRVLTPDGTELAVHTLAHDHADEQPFTRTQRGVRIPVEVESVVVEGRDQVHGFGGRTVTVTLPDR